MRKYLLLLFVIYLSCNCYAQINILQNNTRTQDPNEIFINGISTREDIGGVDIQTIPINYSKKVYEWKHDSYSHTVNENGYQCIKVENYNEFPVTVLIQYEYRYPLSRENMGKQDGTKVATISLPPAKNGNYPAKEIKLGIMDGHGQTLYPEIKRGIISITRKVGGR